MSGSDKEKSEKKKITIATVEEFLQKIEQALMEYLGAKQSGSSAEEADARRELSMLLPEFFKYRAWVEQEIQRCKENLEKISAKKAAISTEQTLAKLADAEEKLSEIYRKLLELQKRIKLIAKKINQAFGEDCDEEDIDDDSVEQLSDEIDEIISKGPVY